MSVFGFSELSCTKVYPKYLNFRHQVFNEQQRYHESGNPVFQFNTFNLEANNTALNATSFKHSVGIEYDDYDIPRTLHLAYLEQSDPQKHDENATILGCLRLLPTDGHYMIKDNIDNGGWKNVELLVDGLPMQNTIYEASRIAVAPYLTKDNPLRDTVVENLVYANIELGVRLGVKKMVGIMYHHIWQAVYCKRGVPVKYISQPFHVDDGLPIIIGEIDTSPEVLANLNDRYADKIEKGLIKSPSIEYNAWMTHYYHVNKQVPVNPMERKQEKTMSYTS